MKIYLEVKVKALTFESRVIREKERKNLQVGRNLRGVYSRKHGIDQGEHKNTMTDDMRKALAWGDRHPEEALSEEQKAYEAFWGLQHHRKNVLRKEARDTHIALGFLRGHNYEDMEAFAYTSPRWDNIERMVLRYSEDDPRVIKQRFEEWTQRAKKILNIDQEIR